MVKEPKPVRKDSMRLEIPRKRAILFLYEVAYSEYRNICRKRKPDGLDKYRKEFYRKQLKLAQRSIEKDLQIKFKYAPLNDRPTNRGENGKEIDR